MEGSLMSLELLERTETLHECPRCGKRALAQVSHDRFECLWCRFRRDLSEPNLVGGGGFWAALLSALVVLALFL